MKTFIKIIVGLGIGLVLELLLLSIIGYDLGVNIGLSIANKNYISLVLYAIAILMPFVIGVVGVFIIAKRKAKEK